VEENKHRITVNIYLWPAIKMAYQRCVLNKIIKGQRERE
jgi:hypothetical protein